MEDNQEDLKEETRLKVNKSKKGLLTSSILICSLQKNYSKHGKEHPAYIQRTILLGEIAIQPVSTHSTSTLISRKEDTRLEATSGFAPKRGMVLPFTPLTMTFDSVNYFVDMPRVSFKTQSMQLNTAVCTLNWKRVL